MLKCHDSVTDGSRWSSHTACVDPTAPADELRGDQTIVGIAGGVAPFRERGFVLGLLQLQFYDALLFTRPSMYLRSASRAASMAIGSTARRSSRAIAASTRRPPKVKHRGRPSVRLGRSHR
jgi:hypothetical protein